jgi:RNA polymerase sigma factor (sigma-70 family)
MTSSDAELLEEFVRRKSDAAFGEIVRRYTNLVYAAARRQVRDPDMADDVTQAAFLVLARRASSVSPKYLPAWLLTTTRLCALDAIKKQTRRTHYEREAAMARPEVRESAEIPDPQVAAFLDDAMSRLPARECTALGLRYLQDRPVNDVATAMGVSPNAAQKILSRALVKLRKILGRRGVIVPSTAVLTAALLHESAQTAPATIVISSLSSSGSTLSIAKGVSHMMFLTKVKMAVGLTAAAIFLAGTGSLVAIRALGQTPSPDAVPPPAPVTEMQAAPVAPSVAPYDSPFLELVGCRIKETLSVKLTADVAPPVEAVWVEQQYPQIKWTIDPALAANVESYSISVALRTDPTGAQTIRADKSAMVQPLVEQMGFPGDYDIKVLALAADGRIVASAAAHILVNPLPMTQIMINDITADGLLKFTCVTQGSNASGDPLSVYRFMNSDFVNVQTITDEDGRSIPFTTRHQGQTFQYRCTFNPPIAPGAAEFVSSSGTMTKLVRNLSPGVFAYAMNQSPGGNAPTRRMELYRLPMGATLIYSSPNLASRVVDGRMQLYMETIIPMGGSNLVTFRYRLAGN